MSDNWSDDYGPRDRHDPDDAEREGNQPTRPRGRMAPARAQTIVQIAVDDVVLGEVNPKELTAGAQFDLEDCKGAYDLVDWIVRYAGGDKEQAVAALRPMKAQALVDLLLEISTALGRAVEIPKRNARR